MSGFKNGRAMLFTLGGAICGPFFGVWTSLIAVARIPAGIAATLNGTTPIWIIPGVVIFFKEKVSLRALLGAILAVGGVAVLFLADEILGVL
jgi:drug/metabolite transporter (DMT)-like permease